MEEFRVIIAGGRNFQDFELLETKMNFFLSQVKTEKKIVIVCGKARGADTFGERYGEKNGYEVRDLLDIAGMCVWLKMQMHLLLFGTENQEAQNI